MGREINRVPLDFDFPLEHSYIEYMCDKHAEECAERAENQDCECDFDLSPPEGPGWQLWQTVNRGPISPVFKTAEELIDWMCTPVPVKRLSGPWAQGYTRGQAENLVKYGSAPSFVIQNGIISPGVDILKKDE